MQTVYDGDLKILLGGGRFVTLLDGKVVKKLGLDREWRHTDFPDPPPFTKIDEYVQGILEVYVRSMLFDAQVSPTDLADAMFVNPNENPPRQFRIETGNPTATKGNRRGSNRTFPHRPNHSDGSRRTKKQVTVQRDLRGRFIPTRYLAGVDAEKRATELTVTRDLYKLGAYVEPPSDVEARKKGLVRPSRYTIEAKRRGIEYRGSIADMAERVVKHYGVYANGLRVAYALKQSFDKGLAAWASGGHRPGATAQNWAAARVNSLVVGGKTAHTADAKQLDMFGPALKEAILAKAVGDLN